MNHDAAYEVIIGPGQYENATDKFQGIKWQASIKQRWVQVNTLPILNKIMIC